MKKIPTAEQMLKEAYLVIEEGKTVEAHTHLVVAVMNNHTKFHVEAALKAAAKNCKLERVSDSHFGVVYNQNNFGQLCISSDWAGDYIRKNEDSILNAYPLSNIK